MRIIDADKLMVEISLIDLEERKHNGFNACVECIEQAPPIELDKECISRKELDKALYEHFHEEDSPNNTTDVRLGAVRNFVKNFPPIDPQEPKTGHWISVNTGKQSHTKDGMAIESVKCSECDEWLTASDEYDCYGRYCPNCGARMESENKE